MKPLAQNTLIQNRYLVVHLIGKGGMGEVYLAVDQRLGSAVALKRTFFKGDEMLGGAFEREAKILGRLRHPVLPKVSDHFSEGDDQFLVMEHISGDDLAKRLESAGKPFPLSWVMFWADQLLDALSYLHAHEPPIVHRDIKPQNLKLTDENHVVLLDFGLSKNTGSQPIAQNSASTGSVVGYTPHFAPMEQIRGFGTDARSDVYSLSATLYQLMTNTVPADALTRADAMLNGLPDPIEPLNSLNLEIPSVVSDIILKGMEVSQDKRYGSAREMQKVLRRAHTQIHDAMSAKTAVFNITPEELASIDQPGDDALPAATRIDSDAVSIPTTVNRPDSLDLEATAAFAADELPESVLQAGVKTEVFLAADGGLAVAEQEIAPENGQVDSAYEENGRFAAPEIPERIEFAGVSEQPDAYATVTAQRQEIESRPAPPVPIQVPVEVATPVSETAQKAPAKKSASRSLAVFGGVFALLVLALGAAGGGWYYYTNFYAAGNVTTPSPSPEPSVMPSPSVEPTVESVATSPEANTSDQAATSQEPVDSNINTEASVPTGTSGPRPVTQRTAPARTVPKATPKPKQNNDRTIILQ